MGARPQPLAVRDTTAARMLDMPASEFRRLVDLGGLPRPIMLGEHARWRFAEIKCIALGIAWQRQDYTDDAGRTDWQAMLDDHIDDERPSRYVSPALRAEIMQRDGEVCAYCETREGPFEIDHIYPVSRGGDNTAENLTVACKPCNRDKRDKTLDEWKGRA